MWSNKLVSTGGIIALGIGAKHWSIRTSTEKFSSLCDQAFTPRELSSVKIVNKAITLRHGSKYKTRPLHRSLNTAFGEQFLFGGEQETDTAYMTKVAVATTSGTGQNPIILSNYGRKDEPRLNYQIEFSLGSRLGLKVWEAAAATSAAPSFFKPFVHPNADRKYLDGALYFNNPIKIANNERKLLWPEVADCHPDLMLSIGTGQNQEETEAGVARGARSQNELEKRKTAKKYGKTDAAEKKQTSRPRRVFRAAGNAKNFFSVLVSLFLRNIRKRHWAKG
jgi:patatin-like phospholipase/acyl hydrolase